MKYLIVGLGNPGSEYASTRHNIGFLVLDELAAKKELSFSADRLGDTCELKHKGRTLILLKPSTYMNLSGKAVRYHLTKHKLDIDKLLVITDDLALPLGKLRMRPKGSNGGHNGLANIEEVLGTQEYVRLRFGIGNDFPKGRQVDFVLSDFDEEDLEELPKLIKKAGNMAISFALQGPARTMSQFNN